MKKIIFLDRDGTLITEPDDFQIDSFEKLRLVDNVIPCLKLLMDNGFKLVMITNQDGLGTKSYPMEKFNQIQQFLIELFKSQGIEFLQVLVCPHFHHQNCQCRKPKIQLLIDYLQDPSIDWNNCYVIGDRASDLELATNLKITGYLIKSLASLKDINNANKSYEFYSWNQITSKILASDRIACIHRSTKETEVSVKVNLDLSSKPEISTGLGFFDHMLEQIGYHGKFLLQIKASGDLHIDHHHLIEDCGIALGQCLKKAISDKVNINRYGFCLPMDESQCKVVLDLSSRAFFVFKGKFTQGYVGSDNIDVNMFKHFFLSLSNSLECTLHITVEGENNHHMIESMFKCFAKTFNVAISRSTKPNPTLSFNNSCTIPSSKESL